MSIENGDKSSIKSLLKFDDPLSSEAIQKLINHKEEDLYVDYKEHFDPSEEKHWLGITTDCMAFANIMGGFIVFGIKDSTFKIVGIPEVGVTALTNTNMVMQKLNRYVSPPFSMIRTKSHRMDSGLVIVVMHIPESKGKTHMFIKEVSYKYRSGTTKVLIHAGTIYVRRSATNNVIEPEDLEFIINRRIEYYKDSIMSKIAKVVEAPTEHKLIIFDPESKTNADQRYAISDSSDAIPVKGMSFTIVPSTDVEELSGWISLSKRDPSFQPSKNRLWYFYSIRNDLTLNQEQLKGIAEFSLMSELPVFYWLRSISAEDIKIILVRVFQHTRNRLVKLHLIDVGAFLGRVFHNKMINKFGESSSILNKRSRGDPSKKFHLNIVPQGNREKLENELTKIAEKLSISSDALEKWKARAIDCHLYARKDKYILK
jgi:hypothetical protein